MTTITREQQKQILIDTANHVISRDNTSPYSENLRELARIALASLEAEKGADPVVFTDERNLHHIARGRETSLIWGKQNQEVGDIPLYRHAQPVPVDKEFIPKNLDKALGVVGVALPESKEEFNFQIERWIQRLIDRVIRYADEFKEQPASVVPEEKCDDDGNTTSEFDHGWNACRAALHHDLEKLNQPVSQTYELPELIEGMEVSVDVSTCDFDAGHRYFGTVTEVSELDTAKNGYILLVQDAKPNFDVNGNSPAIPDDWVMVPKEPTQAMIKAWLSEVANFRGHATGYKAALAAAPQREVK
ncbi:DUF551 domain-containing protein [Salmonella enterica subsp. enterica serovar Corvallis]|uniref:DUF551 domain-containing protein n=1 Tax=Salmonella enterica subsp. enterica serovar Altona TaxID=1151173 RepID=A0A5J0HVG0_SALET|nr:DUF551 domain-containing protein [Salmonella enterica subsp. enterica serovar Altona]EAA6137433.1 DUF551 domain-containing protein [Salmonella enterica subsp. enterica serovar Corvallis]EAY3326855.1 DUF551 domain-containing protein [Salmonella enterica subsp. enterica serovar Typhimurium]EDJ1523881.1 DUF551 domain-containing protein [Salmonella enterica]EEJ2867032.1 DUF551 domain-containing protein [Salmonella enterica subsp. enterica]